MRRFWTIFWTILVSRKEKHSKLSFENSISIFRKCTLIAYFLPDSTCILRSNFAIFRLRYSFPISPRDADRQRVLHWGFLIQLNDHRDKRVARIRSDDIIFANRPFCELSVWIGFAKVRIFRLFVIPSKSCEPHPVNFLCGSARFRSSEASGPNFRLKFSLFWFLPNCFHFRTFAIEKLANNLGF